MIYLVSMQEFNTSDINTNIHQVQIQMVYSSLEMTWQISDPVKQRLAW